MIAKTQAYGIRIVICLARGGYDWFSAEDVSQCSNIPKPFASKLLTQLAENRLVESKRGPHGGFRLAMNCEEISVGMVIAAARAAFRIEGTCSIGLPNCSPEHPCDLDEAIQRFASQLDHLTIAELLEFADPMGEPEGASQDCCTGEELCP